MKLLEIFNAITFNPLKYNKFSSLTDSDLEEIANWGLIGEFSSSGAWDCGDKLSEAIKCVIDGFNYQLREKYPEGFSGIPNEITIYRMVVLNNPEDLKKDNLGYSWFTNPNRINNPDFKEQLDYLKGGNVYLITAKTMENNIDIPRTLFHRDGISLENEIVVKDDSSTKIKLISVNKPK